MSKLIIIERNDAADYFNCDLILLRGAPGSGKSSFADTLQKKGAADHGQAWIITEADNFFIKEDGSYVFVQEHLGQAHAQCVSQTRRILAGGGKVIVANTFTHLFQLRPYLDMIEKQGKSAAILRVYGYHRTTKPSLTVNSVIKHIQQYEVYTKDSYQRLVVDQKPASMDKIQSLLDAPIASAHRSRSIDDELQQAVLDAGLVYGDKKVLANGPATEQDAGSPH